MREVSATVCAVQNSDCVRRTTNCAHETVTLQLYAQTSASAILHSAYFCICDCAFRICDSIKFSADFLSPHYLLLLLLFLLFSSPLLSSPLNIYISTYIYLSSRI